MTTHINLHPSPSFPPNPYAGQTGQILYGVKRIAAWLGSASTAPLTPRQVAYMIEQGRLPTFRMGTIICSTPAMLDEHFRRLADETVSRSEQPEITGEGEGGEGSV